MCSIVMKQKCKFLYYFDDTQFPDSTTESVRCVGRLKLVTSKTDNNHKNKTGKDVLHKCPTTFSAVH
jgi:hypothetical protein